MATSIRAIQMAIALVNVLIFALVFTSLWPFPSGDFNVDLPSPGDVVWGYEDGVVTVSAPYSIDNGGFYDVDDLVIRYGVTNYTDAPIHSGEIDIGSLPAGHVTSDSIDFTFPLLEMYESGATWMVFNDDFLNFAVEVSCYYTMKLVHFYAEYNVSVPWDALIQEGLPIAPAAAKKAIVAARRSYARQLRAEHTVLLEDVRKTGKIVRTRENEDDLRELLDSRAILQYVNDEEWYGVNPLADPEGWR